MTALVAYPVPLALFLSLIICFLQSQSVIFERMLITLAFFLLKSSQWLSSVLSMKQKQFTIALKGWFLAPRPSFLSPTCIPLLLCLEHANCSPLLGSFLFLMTRRPLPQIFLRLVPFHQPGLGSLGNIPEKSCFLHWLKYGAFLQALDYSTALNH